MIPTDDPPQGPTINEDGTFNRPEGPLPFQPTPRPAPSGGSGCGLLFLGGFFLLLALFLYTLLS